MKQSKIITFLSEPSSYGKNVARVERIETHISHLFLVDKTVYKLKKAVKFPYLDFTTLRSRQLTCQHEISVNRRTAPEIYIGVVPVTLGEKGKLNIDGKGEPVDWLVKMHRFDQSNLFSNLVNHNLLDRHTWEKLAEVIHTFHAKAKINDSTTTRESIKEVIVTSIECINKFSPKIFSSEAVDLLAKATSFSLTQTEKLIKERRLSGKERHCHGDLHLGNIVLLNGKPTLFDAIEFNDDLARIDILYDLSFLLMDMGVNDLKKEANIVFNRYMELSDETNSLACLPLFLSMRAMIRAHVNAAAKHDIEAIKYFEASREYLVRHRPQLIAIGGFSGTGKSTIARGIASQVRPAPGALILRSDIIRKKLLGLDKYQKLKKTSYSEEMTHRTYDHMLEQAKITLKAGHSVIVDAVFAQSTQRQAIEKVAQEIGVSFTGFWLHADPSILEDRIMQRLSGASDASVEVMRAQLEYDTGPINWHRYSSTNTPDELSRQLTKHLS